MSSIRFWNLIFQRFNHLKRAWKSNLADKNQFLGMQVKLHNPRFAVLLCDIILNR